MATSSNTYDISNLIKEDVSDVISNIAPYDTPILTAIGSGKAATQPNFEWSTDDLAAAGENAQVEGADAVDDEITDAVRLNNYTQISSKTIKVTGTSDATDQFGKSKEFAYQMAKKGKELKKDMEKTLAGMHQTKSAGTKSVARKTGSLSSFIHKNVILGTDTVLGTTPQDGTVVPTVTTPSALTEEMFQNAIEAAWNAGGEPSKAYMPSGVKKGVSNFFTGRADDVRTQAESTTANVVVDFYVSDFGTIEMYPCRTDRFLDDTVFILDPAQASVRYLRNFQNTPLAKTGDAERSMLLVEYGLEVTNPDAHAAIYGVSAPTA